MALRPPLALAYHGVANLRFADDPYRLFVTPDRVVRDVLLLRRWGYELVTFGCLAERVSRGEGGSLAALTFDDGLSDNATTLAPLLHELGATATVFVVSGWIGAHHPDAPWARMLTSSQVRELHTGGIEIGTHTATHRSLTDLDPETVSDEITSSRTTLEELLDAPVRSLAYPYGAANEQVRRRCEESGISAACRTSGEGTWRDPLDLPRQAMGHGSSSFGLWLKSRDRYEPLMRIPGSRRARRLSRRAHSASRSRRGAAPQPEPHEPR